MKKCEPAYLHRLCYCAVRSVRRVARQVGTSTAAPNPTAAASHCQRKTDSIVVYEVRGQKCALRGRY